MSKFRRVQQWAVYSRQWWLYDAKWQDPFDSAHIIARYLRGGHKPIYDMEQDCGDHVVVINAKHVAMPDDEWRWRYYYHHTRYAKGKNWGAAYDLHTKDPTIVIYKAIFKNLNDYVNSFNPERWRLPKIARLHIYPEEEVPAHIMENVSDQIKQLRVVPKKLTDFTEKELHEYPKIVDYPEDYTIK